MSPVALTARRGCCWAPSGAEAIPTVSETKDAFIKAYSKPIPAMFNTVLQEMIVMQHMTRFNAKYTYNPVRPTPEQALHLPPQRLLPSRSSVAVASRRR
jgi:hypothetical protein